MTPLFKQTCVAVLLLFCFSSYSQKASPLEMEFNRCETDYNRGDYKRALIKSQILLKKTEKNENLFKAKVLAHIAKVYDALSKFEQYHTHIDLSVKTLSQVSKEDVKAYVQTLLQLSEAYIQYGDLTHAEQVVSEAMLLMEKGKISDTDLSNTVKSRKAEIFYRQGYWVKADSMLPELIAFRRSRVVKQEAFTDAKGKTRKRKLTKPQIRTRARLAAELMNLYSLVTLSNGNYTKADSLLSANSTFIRKHLDKKDITYIENMYQKGLLLEAFQKSGEANEKFDKAGKISQAQASRYRPMSKQIIRIQERRIISHKKVKRDQQAKKRKKIYVTRVTRSYGKNSLYYASSIMLEAEGYLIQKDYKKAEGRIMQVLGNPLYFPKYHPERVRALTIFYNICMESDQYLKAEECLGEIVDIQKVLHGPHAPVSAMAGLNLAGFYVGYSSKFKQAEDLFISGLNIVSREVDHLNSDFISYSYAYASLLEYTDRFDEALKVLTAVMEENRKNYGERHPKYAVALERVANIYIDLGRYAEAEKKLTASDEIFKKEGSVFDYNDYSRELETFARLYIIQGQYDEAKKVLRKAMQKQGVAGSDAKLSSGFEELATLNMETGKYQETEKNLKTSLKLKEAKYGAAHRSLVNPLNQLGHLYLITGNFVEADKYAKRAASLSSRIFGDSSVKFAENLKLLGNIYAAVGDYEKAEDAVARALAIQRHQYGQHHMQIATSVNDMALINFYNQEDPGKVEKLLLEALTMTRQCLSEKHPRYASILHNLALFYVETGDLEKAAKQLLQADTIWAGKFGTENVHSAEANFVKGDIAYRKGNFDEARSAYTKARDIFLHVFDNPNHPGYLSAVSKIGQMSYIRGDFKTAVKCLNETTSSYLSYIQSYFPSLSEREKNKFWIKIQRDFEFYNALVLKLKDQDPSLVSNAYNYALSTKSLLLNSSIKVRQRIFESNDSELIRKFEEWVAKKEFLTSAISLTSEQRKESGIDIKMLEAEMEELEKELSTRSEVFAQNFQKKSVYDWKDIRKSLAANEVAVEIIRFRTYHQAFTDTVIYAAMIITPETRSYPEMVVLEKGKELEQKWLKYYRNCIRFNIRDKVSYDRFWKPVKDRIKDNVRIYFSPEGVYNQVNLETLYDPEKKYVLDQNEVVVVSNTRDLISRKLELEKSTKVRNKNTSDKTENRKIALFGNPNYYTSDFSFIDSSDQGTIGSLLVTEPEEKVRKINQLPGAEREVQDLHELLLKSGWDSEAFLNETATEGKIKALKNVRVLHIATHGFFMEDVRTDLEGINQNKAVQNPLFRSGLLLKDGGHLMDLENVYEFNSGDGVLTAYEAMNLNIDNTDLVVLSACETGLGKVQLGEGVYGLQRSFLVAGAKTVVMSLFKVSDEVTQELMINFYQNWIVSGNKRQAFIEAKKTIREKYEMPILWGSFIMVGMD